MSPAMVSRAYKILFFIVGAALTLSCEKSAPTFDLQVSPASARCPSDKTSIEMVVISPDAWTLVSSEPWCKPVQMDGGPTSSFGTHVYLNVDENKSFERSCTVSLTGMKNGAKKVITITQDQNSRGMYFQQTEYRVSGQAQKVEISYFSDTEVTVVPLSPWITVESVDAQSIVLGMDEHKSLLKRRGEVRITSSGGQEKVIVLFQGDGVWDPNLYKYILKEYDTDGDEVLSQEEADAVESLVIRFFGDLHTVEGLECFRHLKTLKIINRYPWDYHPQVDYRFDGHPSLTALNIVDADIGLLSVKNCPNLRFVHFFGDGCYHANISIDLDNNPSLFDFQVNKEQDGVWDTNVEKLQIRRNPLLSQIIMRHCEFAEEPDFSQVPRLDYLDLRISKFVSPCIDLSQNVYLNTLYVTTKYIILPRAIKGSVQLHVSGRVIYE